MTGSSVLRSSFFLGLAIALCPSMCAPQVAPANDAAISGTVTLWSKHSQHRQGVPIAIEDDKGESTEAFTDKDGKYQLVVPASGFYRISVSYQSYCPVHRPRFFIGQTETLIFDFDLLPCIYPESFGRKPVNNIVPYREERVTAGDHGEALIVYGSRSDNGAETHYEELHLPFNPAVTLPVTIRVDNYTIQGDSAVLDRESLRLTIQGKIAMANGGKLEASDERCVTLYLSQNGHKPLPCNR